MSSQRNICANNRKLYISWMQISHFFFNWWFVWSSILTYVEEEVVQSTWSPEIGEGIIFRLRDGWQIDRNNYINAFNSLRNLSWEYPIPVNKSNEIFMSSANVWECRQIISFSYSAPIKMLSLTDGKAQGSWRRMEHQWAWLQLACKRKGGSCFLVTLLYWFSQDSCFEVVRMITNRKQSQLHPLSTWHLPGVPQPTLHS